MKRRLLVSACYLLSGVISSQGSAQAVPRIKFEKYKLPNGLEVILHEDHSTPIISVNTWYHVGSADEKPGRTGFAHLFEHLMFMGSQHVPNGVFDKELEAAGGDNNASTAEDRTNYYEDIPSNALPLALWLDSDRMGYLLSTMDKEKVDLQRDVVKNERREGVENSPYGISNEIILATLYPKTHPYSWPVIGSMADLSAASVEDVKNFFRTYYAPNNATLSIAGDFDRVKTKQLIKEYFGDIPRGPALPARPIVAAVVLQRDTFIVAEDRVQLPRAFYEWPTPKQFSKDDAPLDILAAILASDKNSRLYKRLVYDMQVVQSIRVTQQSTRLASKFEIDVTPKPGQGLGAIDKVINEEIQKIINEPVTEREIARAKNSYRSSFLNRIASVHGKADLLNEYNYLAGTPDYVQRDAARYDAVTLGDVQRVARKYLGQHKLVLTIVPEGKRELMLTGKGGGQ